MRPTDSLRKILAVMAMFVMSMPLPAFAQDEKKEPEKKDEKKDEKKQGT